MAVKFLGIRRKLASCKGASITFALLLFLVCSIVGVIVLVAATAASGRMSRLAESDSRYYAVDSAVQLLEEELRGREVTLTLTRSTNVMVSTTSYVYLDGAEEKTEVVRTVTTGTPAYSWSVKTSKPGDETRVSFSVLSAMPFLQNAALYYALGALEPDQSALETVWNQLDERRTIDLRQSATRSLGTVTLTLRDNTISHGAVEGALPVTVSASLDTSGRLLLTLSCKSDEDKAETYIATLIFNPGKKLIEPASTVPQGSGTPPASGIISETTVTEPAMDYLDTKEAVFTWTFAGMLT